MKNCQRLDNVATNMIPFEESAAKFIKKNKKLTKLKKSNTGSIISKELGGEWSESGSEAEISAKVGDIKAFVRVSKDANTSQYKYSISFDTTDLSSKSLRDTNELRQSLSNSLVEAVASVAECGNKLG